jgi:hypothetical protein
MIRGAHFQYRLATACLQGMHQNACHQLLTDMLASELGMDREAGNMHFVSNNPGTAVSCHSSLVHTIDDLRHEQLRDIAASQLAEEDITGPWRGEGEIFDVEDGLKVCFGHHLDADGEP